MVGEVEDVRDKGEMSRKVWDEEEEGEVGLG
jgi:hypothetical protein